MHIDNEHGKSRVFRMRNDYPVITGLEKPSFIAWRGLPSSMGEERTTQSI